MIKLSPVLHKYRGRKEIEQEKVPYQVPLAHAEKRLFPRGFTPLN